MAAPEGMLLSAFSRITMGATVLAAPQPTVPVAFSSRMHAGLPGRTVLIAALSWPTLCMLAALHAPAQHEIVLHAASTAEATHPHSCSNEQTLQRQHHTSERRQAHASLLTSESWSTLL